MHLFRTLFTVVLMLALISSGFASPTNTVIGTSNTAINSGATNYQADEDAYLRDVVKPANDANRLTPEMAAILERHLGRLENNNVPPRRDRGSEPDDAGYSFRDNDENLVPDLDWRDISEDGQQLQPGDDWNSGPLAFEFVFEWYGEEYNSVNVNSNGWLSLNPDDRQTAINLPECPNAGAPNPAFCVLNYDLDPRNGGALYFWTNEEDEAIVSFVDYPNYGNNDLTTTCQVIFSGDGSVLYQYAEFNGHDGQNANVGYESPDGQMGASISFREGGGYLEDGRVIRIANQWIIDEDNPHIVVDPEDLEFGQQIVDRESTMEVEATNLGGVDLTVSAITTEGDGFSTAGLEEDLVVASGESFMIEVTFAAGAEQEYEGALVIESDAVNAEEGLTTVPLFGEGVSPLDISIDPQAIESELNTGEMSNHVITVSNAGGEDWMFETEVVIVEDEEERDQGRRGVRSVQDAGPRRDDPTDSRYALFVEANPWGGSIEGLIFRQVDDLDYEVYNLRGFENADLDEFDVVWVCHSQQSDQFNRAYNDNQERFEEFVDGGGAYYASTGTNMYNVNPNHPGGLNYTNAGSSNGRVQVSGNPRDDNYNYLAELMEWEPDTQLRGSALFHVHYLQDNIDNLENSDWHQVIVNCEDHGTPGIIAYSFGNGFCVVAGTTDGHQHANFNQPPDWGSAGVELLWYLDYLANAAAWLTYAPEEGVVEGESEVEIMVMLNAYGLEEGTYEADLHIIGEVDFDEVVNIVMEVTAAPDIQMEWAAELGFDEENPENSVVDWNAAYPDLFNGFVYDISLMIDNAGTADLAIDGVAFEGDAGFSVVPDEFDVLGAGESLEITVSLEAEETGMYEAVMTFTSNDPDEGEFSVALMGETGDPPIIRFNPNALEPELHTGQVEDYEIAVSNVGEAPLRFEVEVEIISEPGEERDAGGRNVRSTDRAVGPNRDDFGDAIAQFGWQQAPANRYKAGIAWDSDQDMMWLTSYSPNWIGLCDPGNDYEIVMEFQPQGTNPMGAAWREGVLYTVPWANNFLSTWDAEGNALGNLNFPSRPTAVSYSEDGEFFVIITDVGGWRFLWYAFDGENLEEIGSAPVEQGRFANRFPRSVCWVDGHPDGPMWINAGTNIYELEVNDDFEVGEIVQQMQWQGNQDWDGIGHDGENLWLGGYNLAEYLIIEDGITEVNWIGVLPEEGGLAGGEELIVTVTINAFGLVEGDYEADVIFISNDPDDGRAAVNVLVHIEGAPDIYVDWSEDGGWMDPEDGESVLDFNMYHPDVFNGFPYGIPVWITNVGTEILTVNDFTFAGDGAAAYSTDPEGFEEIAPDETAEVMVIFESEDSGEYLAVMSINSNDPDEEAWEINAMATSGEPPALTIDPQAFDEEMVTGEIFEREIIVSNDGEAELRFVIESEIIAEPGDERDQARRSVRSVSPVREFNNNATRNLTSVSRMPNSQDGEAVEAYMREHPLEDDQSPSRDPLPDDPPGSVFALVTAANPWGYDLNRIFNDIEDLQWDRFQNFNQDFDLDDYDAIWVGNYNQDGWTNVYNENLERIEEWVDGGGAYYMCSGTNFWGVAPVHPGGLVRQPQVYHNTGVTVVPPEECYMFELMEWDEGTNMQGNSFHHSVYQDGAIEEIENTDEVQLLIDNPNGQHAVLRYTYGGGQCVVSGSTDGFLHNNPGQYIWGAAGGALLYYLDFLANSIQWLSYEPEEGTLDQGGDESIIVTLNAEGLFGGEYIAEMHFLSNDPADPDQVVDITINVTGAPDINPVWDADFGYDEENMEESHIDFNLAYSDLYNGFDYDVIVTIENVGTDDLAIDEISFSDNDAGVWSVQDEFDVIAGGEELDVAFTFNSEERGEFASTATIISNDPDEDTFDIPVEAIAYLPPILSLDPDAIEVEMVTGEIVREAINLTNDGDAELRWNAEVLIISEPEEERDAGQRNVRSIEESAGPNRDDFGDAIAQFNWQQAGANRYKAGIAWDSDQDMMWLTSYSPNWIGLCDPGNDYEIVMEFQPQGTNPMGAAWREGVLYTVPWANNFLSTWDAEGNALGNLNFPNRPTAVSYSAEGEFFVIITDVGGWRFMFYAFDGENLEEIGSAPVEQNRFAGRFPRSVCWVDGHPDGPMWINAGTNIFELEVNDDFEVGEIVQQMQWQGNQDWDGIGHDGENMWLGGYNLNEYLIIDDGITELRWVSIEPEEGTLDGGAESDAIVTLDANHLFGGDYEADVMFYSNDPENPELAVNVLMHVTPAPDIKAEWDEDFGWMDPLDGDGAVVDFNLAFDPDLFSGGPYSIPVWVSNEGTDDLQINEVSSDNEAFSHDWNEDQDVLSPGEGFEMMITYEVEVGDAGDYEGTITINSNDGDQEDYDILCTANSSEPPQMVLDPESHTIPEDDRIFTGEQVEFVITILNDGEATLNWWAETEILQEPGDEERDAVQRSIRSTDGQAGPVRDDAGDQLGAFQGINAVNQYCSIIGWDRDNDRMYVSNYNNSTIASYSHDGNYEEFEEESRMNFQNPMDGTWANGFLYVNTIGQAAVARINADGENVGNVNVGPNCYGLAADEENGLLFALINAGNYPISVFELEDNGDLGDQLGVINNHMPYHGNVFNFGIEYVEEHPDGQLWITNYQANTLHQIAVDTDEWTCIDGDDLVSFGVGGIGQVYNGVAHDGENIWVGGWSAGDIRIYDDGNAELRWLSMEPTEGSGPDDGENETPGVEPGGESEVIVLLDATGLLGGEYIADIIFFSNDPDDGVEGIIFPVTMWVEGVPDIDPSWDEEAGYAVDEEGDGDPDNWVIDFNGAHPEVYNGGDYVVWVEVANMGTDDLQINDVFTNTDDVTSDWNEENDVFGPEESFILGVILNAEEAGPIAEDAMLTISSNDPDEEDIMIPLVAEAALAPIIGVDPQAIESDLITGDIEEFVLTVSNDGGEGAADLWWDTDSEVLFEPGDEEERDQARRSVRSVESGPVAKQWSQQFVNSPQPVSVTGDYIPSEEAKVVSPRRDEPNEIKMLHFKSRGDNGFGWFDGNDHLAEWANLDEEVDQADIEDFADIDLDDYDLICSGEDMSAAFFQGFMQNREQIEEYVDGGGLLSMWTGSNSFQNIDLFSEEGDVPVVRGPSGDWGDVNEIFVNDDGDGLIEGIEEDFPILTPFEFYRDDNQSRDRVRIVMRGNSLNYAVVQQADLPEDAVWYYRPQQQQNTAIIADWPFGSGYVLFTGITGTLFWRNNWDWSSQMEVVNLTRWADGVNAVRWLSWAPGSSSDEGQEEIPVGGEDVEVIVTINATGLLGGDYEAELYFYSNDPTAPNDEPDVTVTINLTVSGVANIMVSPGGPEEGNGVVDFGVGYFGYAYAQDVMVENVGTDDLQLFDVISDDNYPDFFVNPDDLEDFILAPGEEAPLTIHWTPDPENGEGDVGATLMAESNDPRYEEELYPIEIGGGSAALEAPVLVLDPMAIDIEEMDENAQLDEVVNVSNEGGSLLVWAAEFESTNEPGDEEERDQGNRRQVRSISDAGTDKAAIGMNLRNADDSRVGPRRDDAGDVLFRFNIEHTWLGGFDWDPDEEVMWVASYSQPFIHAYAYDGDGGVEQVFDQNLNANSMAMGFLDGVVYTNFWAQNVIYRYNEEGENLGNLNVNIVQVMDYGHSNDNTLLYVLDGQRNIHVLDVENDYESIGVIRAQGLINQVNNQWFRSMCWVDAHPDGQLWLGTPNHAWQFFIDDDFNAELVQDFQTVGNSDWCAIGHDGENLWRANTLNDGGVTVYDDGVAEIRWFTFDPEEGQLDPGGDIDLNILLNSEGLVGGLYEGTLTFFSNDPRPVDPDDPYNVVTISMNVIGQGVADGAPRPRPYEDAEALEFGEVFAGGQAGVMVEIINNGSLAFEITGVEVEAEDADDWSSDIEDGTMVQAFDSITRTLLYTPNNPGDHAGTIWIMTDADQPEDGTIGWDVSGNAVTGPSISTDPDELGMSIPVDGDPRESLLIISNAPGEDRANLTYSIYTEVEEEEEERDMARRGVRSIVATPDRDERGDPDEGGYEWRDSEEPDGPEFEWIDIEDWDETERFNPADDWNSGNQDFGFDFPWYGGDYGSINICSNGWMSLDPGQGGNRQIGLPQPPNAQNPNAVFLINNFDLHPFNSGYILYWTNEEMAVVTYMDFPYIGDQNERYTMQAVFHNNGFVKFQYLALEGQNANGVRSNIGYENGNGQLGASIIFREAGRLTEELAIGIGTQSMFGIPWLSVDPMASPDGGVPPGEDSEVTLTWDATDLEEGEYDGLLIIESNDPETPFLIMDVLLIVGEVEPVHFTEFDRDGDTHTITVTEAMFDGDDIGRGWEIGLFDPDGNLGGAGVWNGQALPIMAYGGEEADQFDGNEAFSFVYWDPNDGDEGMEWGATPTWGEGPEVFNAGSESTVSLNGGRTREFTIELGDGWDMISVNVMLNPDEYLYEGENPGPEVREMFGAWAGDGNDHQVELLKDAEGRFWRPQFNFTNIPFWDYAQGYQIKLHEGDAITWEGEEMDAQSDVPMSTGWQMIGYFPTYDLDASGPDFYVLSDIIDRVFLAKNGAGQFMRPAFRFSNMPPWSEGYGYQVKLDPPEEGDGDLIFNYPEEMQEGAYVGEAGANGGHWTSPTASDANMSVLITEFSGIELGEGDQVAAFSTSGMQIGLGTITEGRSGIAVWADEENTEAIEGALHGEAFTLKLWDADKAVEHNLEVNTINWGKGLVYETNSFVALEVTVQSIIPDVYSLSQNFPNPFNSITKLSFGLPEDSEVSISVFDVSGRLVTTLVNGQLTAGNHVVAWNAQGNATGLYLVKMETLGGFSAVRKVVLTK